jgi:FkbM family methyltransferase
MSKYLRKFSDWAELLDHHPLVILDVGANDLGTTCAFKSLFPDAYIHAFEPDARAIKHGKARLSKLDRPSERITFHECAVGHSDGVRDFYPSNGTSPAMIWYETGYDLSGSLKVPVSARHPGLETVYFENPVQVRCTTLDSWLREYRPRKVDLVWMDVQGAELEVIRGGELVFNMAKWVYLECMETRVYMDQPSLEEIICALPFHRLCESFSDGNHLFRRVFD